MISNIRIVYVHVLSILNLKLKIKQWVSWLSCNIIFRHVVKKARYLISWIEKKNEINIKQFCNFWIKKANKKIAKFLMLWVGSRYAICIVIILRSAAAVGPRALGSSFCTGLVAIVTVGLFWRNDTVCLALALRTKTFVNLCGKVQQYFYKKNCYSINLHEKKRKLCTSKTID